MQGLDELLEASGADEAFKADVRAFLAHRPAPRIVLQHPLPRVKVLRLLAQLLHAERRLPVERVLIDAWAGCSDLRGTLGAVAGGRTHEWDFVWDCRWRAEHEGLLTPWGLPDQSRAAREWGWQCFARWEARAVAPNRARAPG